MFEDSKGVIKSRHRSTDNAMNKREWIKQTSNSTRNSTHKPKDRASNSGTSNVAQLKFR